MGAHYGVPISVEKGTVVLVRASLLDLKTMVPNEAEAIDAAGIVSKHNSMPGTSDSVRGLRLSELEMHSPRTMVPARSSAKLQSRQQRTSAVLHAMMSRFDSSRVAEAQHQACRKHSNLPSQCARRS